jgi:hypothetical protein
MKENFLRALGGEIPECVPRYSYVGWNVRPSFLSGQRVKGIGTDIWGVEWDSEGTIVPEALPKPGVFILKDIRKWRDVIKFPDFSGVDWEATAKKDLENFNPEFPRAGGVIAGQGFFQHTMNFMGFTEGLIACIEEPEEVRAMIEYVCDSYLSLADKYLQYYKPDFIIYGDDTAHERGPFLSLEVFRQIYEPVWRRYIKFFKDRGYLVSHHNCGKPESILEDLVDMGVNSWDPAQDANDLVGIKKKFGRKLMICGAFEARWLLSHFDVTEEQVRSKVKEVMDKFAPGGGFAFTAGMTVSPDPVVQQRNEWIADEYEKLKATYYK